MRIQYDAKADTLTLVLRDGPVAECDERRPGITLDYDAAGNLLFVEILEASRRVHEPRSVSFTTIA